MLKNEELIEVAVSALKPKWVDGRLFGNVAAALRTRSGSVYTGVCIDTRCGLGFCAEHSAIAAMVTAGEYEIAAIVAVWRNDDVVERPVYVVSPCGRCRGFVCAVDESNIDTQVLVSTQAAVPLRDLLPKNDWPTDATTEPILIR